MADAAQIADEHGVAPETVHGWIRSGEQAAADLSLRGSSRPRFRVRREDLDAFFAARAVVPRSMPAPRPRRNPHITQYV